MANIEQDIERLDAQERKDNNPLASVRGLNIEQDIHALENRELHKPSISLHPNTQQLEGLNGPLRYLSDWSIGEANTLYTGLPNLTAEYILAPLGQASESLLGGESMFSRGAKNVFDWTADKKNIFNNAFSTVTGGNPDEWDNRFHGAGTSAGYYLTGLGVGGLAQGLWHLAPAVATGISYLASSALEALTEGGNVASDLYAQDKTRYNDAYLGGLYSLRGNLPFDAIQGVGEGILSAGLDKLIPGSGLLANYARGLITEETNELLQETRQQAVEEAVKKTFASGDMSLENFNKNLSNEMGNFGQHFNDVAADTAWSTLITHTLLYPLGSRGGTTGHSNTLTDEQADQLNDVFRDNDRNEEFEKLKQERDNLQSQINSVISQPYPEDIEGQLEIVQKLSNMEDQMHHLDDTVENFWDNTGIITNPVQDDDMDLFPDREELSTTPVSHSNFDSLFDTLDNILPDVQQPTNTDNNTIQDDMPEDFVSDIEEEQDTQNVPIVLPLRGTQETSQNSSPAIQNVQGNEYPSGNTARVRTINGTEADIRYRIVDADNLIVSTNETGEANPNYPQELQPRQRNREASHEQIARMSDNIDPELLAENRLASDGAPIIGNDNVVESGNGRVMALRRAYRYGRAENYRTWLRDNVSRFGLNAEDIKGMKKPILVRERISDVDRVTFTREANESSTSQMSMTEHAMNDAQRITPEMLTLFDPDKSLPANHEFIQAFSGIIPQSERGDFIQKDGRISKSGLDRIQNALMAKAYNDTGILNRLNEVYDDDIKNVSNALLQAAPKMASFENGGYNPDISISQDIVEAVHTLAKLRQDGESVADYIAQIKMFGEISDEAKKLLQFFDKNKRSAKRISRVLIHYADSAMNEAKQGQYLMFDDSARDKGQILDEAIRYAENDDTESYNQTALPKEMDMAGSFTTNTNGTSHTFTVMPGEFSTSYPEHKQYFGRYFDIKDGNNRVIARWSPYTGKLQMADNNASPNLKSQIAEQLKQHRRDYLRNAGFLDEDGKLVNDGNNEYRRNYRNRDDTTPKGKSIHPDNLNIEGRPERKDNRSLWRRFEDNRSEKKAFKHLRRKVQGTIQEQLQKIAEQQELDGRREQKLSRERDGKTYTGSLTLSVEDKARIARNVNTFASEYSLLAATRLNASAHIAGMPVNQLAKLWNLKFQADIDENTDTRGWTDFKNAEYNNDGSLKKSPETIIHLTKSADPSTTIHELAHVFLKDFQDLIATVSDLPADVRQDWLTLSKWLGISDIDPKSTRVTRNNEQNERWNNAHEKFAVAFEQYCRTGKAPTSALRSAFERFRVWLRNIYTSIRDMKYRGSDGKDHDVEVSTQIKAVFDRMLCSDVPFIPSSESMNARWSRAGLQGHDEGPYKQEAKNKNDAQSHNMQANGTERNGENEQHKLSLNLPFNPNELRTEAGHTIEEAAISEMIVTPEGSLDLGYIPENLAEFPAGSIRANAGSVKHAENRHGEQIRGMGYDNAKELLLDVVNNYTQIRRGNGKALLLSVQGNASHSAMGVVELVDDNGVYRVKTLRVTRDRYLKNKELLFTRSEPNAIGPDTDLTFSSEHNHSQGKSELYARQSGNSSQSVTSEGYNVNISNTESYNQILGIGGARRLDEAEGVTTRMDNLKIARKMERKGLSVRKMWLATGWMRGRDNKWRYEIQDGNIIRGKLNELHKLNRELEKFNDIIRSQVEINPNTLIKDIFTPEQISRYNEIEKLPDVHLHDVFNSPQLFEAYPDLRNIKIWINNYTDDDSSAVYYSDVDAISINGSDEIFNNSRELRRTLIHEIQHAIQVREGFAGGSYYSLGKDSSYKKFMGKFHSIMQKLDPDTASRVSDALYETINSDDDTQLQAILQSFSAKELKAYHDAMNALNKANDRGNVLFSKYMRHSGETEARNSETRSNWGNKRRRNTTLDKTEDVPRSEQIVGKLQRKQSSNTNEHYNQIIGVKGAEKLDKKNGNTWLLDNLDIAQKMMNNGNDAKTIRLATGWELAQDDKWRYEIQDGNIDIENLWQVFQNNNEELPFSLTLKQLYNNSDLFNAYPELTDLTVEFKNGLNHNEARGAYFHSDDKKKRRIEINAMRGLDGIQSTLIHEIQHAVQYIEGFAEGGHGTDALIQGDTPTNIGRKQLQARLDFAGDNVKKAADLYSKGLERKAEKIAASFSRKEMASWNAVKNMIDNLGWNMHRFDPYYYLGGETEARNVQAREPFSPEKRRNTLLSDTQDNDDWLIHRNGYNENFDIVESYNQHIHNLKNKYSDTLNSSNPADINSRNIFSNNKGFISPETIEKYRQKATQQVTHATGHIILGNRFSLKHVGTGEGGDMRGYGIYFEENPIVAQHYRKYGIPNFGNGTLHVATNDGLTFSAEDKDSWDNSPDETTRMLLNYIQGIANKKPDLLWKDILPILKNALSLHMAALKTSQHEGETLSRDEKRTLALLPDVLKKAENIKDVYYTQDKNSGRKGNIYNVSIPANEFLLNWDASIDEQPEHVKNAIRKIQQAADNILNRIFRDELIDEEEKDDLSSDLWHSENGGELYTNIVYIFNNLDEDTSRQATSALFLKFGVPGLRYWDGLSEEAIYSKYDEYRKNNPLSNGRKAFSNATINGLEVSNDKGYWSNLPDDTFRNVLQDIESALSFKDSPAFLEVKDNLLREYQAEIEHAKELYSYDQKPGDEFSWFSPEEAKERMQHEIERAKSKIEALRSITSFTFHPEIMREPYSPFSMFADEGTRDFVIWDEDLLHIMGLTQDSEKEAVEYFDNYRKEQPDSFISEDSDRLARKSFDNNGERQISLNNDNGDNGKKSDNKSFLQPETLERYEQLMHHGTSNILSGNRFDLRYVGSGEGNQMFGYGIYLAENPDVAEYYKGENFNNGSRYIVDGPENDTLLDWDAQMYEQPTYVFDALKNSGLFIDDGFWYLDDFETGKKFYHRLGDLLRSEIQHRYDYNIPENVEPRDFLASKKLNQLGIHGLRYLDGFSRTKGKGSHNFVIWNTDTLKVLGISPDSNTDAIEYFTAEDYHNAQLDSLDNNSDVYDYSHRDENFRLDDLYNSHLDEVEDDGFESYRQSQKNDDKNELTQYTPEEQLKAIQKKYKGSPQWLKAPNGKQTNLSQKQWVQVRTANFKNWFGDWENEPQNSSKVLDENGEPLIVYHGTLKNNRFEVFNTSPVGAHFGTKNVALDRIAYSLGFQGRDDNSFDYRSSGKIFQCFLNIRNPMSTSDNSDWKSVIQYAQSRGHDGIIYDNDFEDKGNKSFIIFNPNQVKSSNKNNGEFSSAHDEIYQQVAKLQDNPILEKYSQQHIFNNPDTEAAYRRSQKSHKEPSVMDNIKKSIHELGHGFKGDFPLLAKDKDFTAAREILRIMNRNSNAKTHATMVSLYDSLHGLNSEQFDIFSRLMLLNNIRNFAIANPASRDNLPMGYNSQSLVADYNKFLALAKNDKAIINAIQAEHSNNKKARQDLIDLANKLGFRSLAKRLLSNDLFLVQYSDLLSGNDFNTNYIIATADLRTSFLQDLERLQAVQKLKVNYDKKNELLKKYGNDWKLHIPDGYSIFNPLSGQFIQSAHSLTDNVLGCALEQAGQQLGLSDKTMSALRAKVSDKFGTQLMVLPDQITQTLLKLSIPPQHTALANFAKSLTSAWKKYVLYAPTRFWKYNLRNITGDMDAVLAGDPSALRFVPQAAKELYTAYYGDISKVSDELKEFQARGGALTLQSAQELGDYKQLREFNKLISELDAKGKSAWQNLPHNTWKLIDKFAWSGVQKFSDFREQLLRYATYLDYLHQMQNNPDGLPSNWGASNKDEVMAIDDIRDRAFKMANELLGAYDQVSETGKQLRELIIPFYSWMEVNAKRYLQLLKNGITEDVAGDFASSFLKGQISNIPYYSYKVGKTLLFVNLFSILLNAFNRFLFPDDDDKLPPDIKQKPHITLGHGNNGNTLYFTQVGALGDNLEWFGLDTFTHDLRQIFNGQLTVTDWLKNLASAPVNKIINGVNPFLKMPFEIASGQSFYPSVSNPRSIRDTSRYIAQSLGLYWPYKAVMGEPRNDWHEFRNIFIYSQDADEAAYYYTLSLVRNFKENVLGQKFSGYSSTKRTNSLRNLKTAIRFNDKEAIRRSLSEYYSHELGGTRQGLNTSLRNMNPLQGLNPQRQRQFLKWIDKEDRPYVKRAQKYFQKLLRNFSSSM